MMADFAYTYMTENLADGTGWDANTIHTSLHTSTTTVDTEPDIATMSAASTLAEVAAGNGYTAGGYVHTTASTTRQDGTNLTDLIISENATWTITSDKGSVTSAVVVDWITNLASSVPWFHFDVSFSGTGTWTIDWSGAGIVGQISSPSAP
jgi:hypothetical protein